MKKGFAAGGDLGSMLLTGDHRLDSSEPLLSADQISEICDGLHNLRHIQTTLCRNRAKIRSVLNNHQKAKAQVFTRSTSGFL
jgi:hypothetical protein